MQTELSPEETRKLIETYDDYTYHEFSMKPALLQEYIELLKADSQIEKIDQIFLCYLEQFNQFFEKEDAQMKQQLQIQNSIINQEIYPPSYDEPSNDQSKSYLAMISMLKSKKKFKKLLLFLVIIAYTKSLNLKKFLNSEKVKDFDELFFESLLLFAKQKDNQQIERESSCKQAVYFVHQYVEKSLKLHNESFDTRILSHVEFLTQLAMATDNESILSIEMKGEILYALLYFHFIAENYPEAAVFALKLRGISSKFSILESSGCLFDYKTFESIEVVCFNFPKSLKTGTGSDTKLGSDRNQTGLLSSLFKQPGSDALSPERSANEEMEIEMGSALKQQQPIELEEEQDSIFNKQRKEASEQFELIEQDFYNSFTSLTEEQQVCIADSLLQLNLNTQNNIDLENQKKLHQLLCKEELQNTNLSLNLLTIQIQTDGIANSTIESFTRQCQEIILKQGMPIPSSIFAFFMTLSKCPPFEDSIAFVISSIESIIKTFCNFVGLNYAAIYENLSLSEGYDRNERREGILGMKNFSELYSVYTLIMLKNIFYLRWVIVKKKQLKEAQLPDTSIKNEDILKNVYTLWNIMYLFYLKRKPQMGQFISITNNYNCLQIIKAVTFSYWARLMLENVHAKYYSKRSQFSNRISVKGTSFSLAQIGNILASDDVCLATEQDIFGFNTTYSLRFEEFDEYLLINSLQPQFSVKSFGDEIYELILSSIFRQEKKMLKQYTSEQTNGNTDKNINDATDEVGAEQKLQFLGKKEQNQYKSYKKYAIEKIRFYYLSGNYSKSLRLLIQLMNQNFLQKYKNQEIFTKESINQTLATSLYHQKCYVECLVCLQFSEKINYGHLQQVLEKINYFNYSYIPLLVNITLIKQLIKTFNKDKVLVNKLIARLQEQDCYQCYSETKAAKIKTVLKVKFLKMLSDNQFEIQQIKVVSSSLEPILLSNSCLPRSL